MKEGLVLGNTKVMLFCLNENHSLLFFGKLFGTLLVAYIVFENNIIGQCQLSEKITIFAS
jgi:hypothetical protein